MNPEKFFVNKSSLEMLDVFRAYGLAFLLSGDEENEVRIRDIGYAYIVEAKGPIPEEPSLLLFEEKDEWRRIFRTFKERKDAKKEHPRKEVQKLVTVEFAQILETHKKLDFIPKIGKDIKNGKTLYQTLDVSGAKGYREEKKDTYHEGTQLEIDSYSWAVVCIGAAWTSVWKETESFILSMVPNPLDVLLVSHRVIQNDLDKKVCTISANSALVHYAIKLATLIAERQLSPNVKYDSIIFNVMRKTGQQPKPAGGGKYSLNLLENLVETSSGKLALKQLERKFPLSKRIKGVQQSLALSLTDFLLNPNLMNFRTLESIYIRGQIRKEFDPWERAHLEEILKHVEVI